MIRFLRDYLPIFVETEHQDYSEYLDSAFEVNWENQLHQFSYLSFHMTFMGYIYYSLMTLKKIGYSDALSFMNNNSKYNECEDPYEFSQFNEKDVIKNFMGVLKFHVNRKNEAASIVDKRDYCAHSSGFIQYNETNIIEHINLVKNTISIIQSRYLEKSIDTFLADLLKIYFLEKYKDTSIANYYLNWISYNHISTSIIIQLDTKLEQYFIEKINPADSFYSSKQASIYLIRLINSFLLDEKAEELNYDEDRLLNIDKFIDNIQNAESSEKQVIIMELIDELENIKDFLQFDIINEVLDKLNELLE